MIFGKFQGAIIIWSVLTYYQVYSSHIDSLKCFKDCQLQIENEPLKYSEFNNIVKTASIRTVYFSIFKGQQLLYDQSQNIQYAWIREDVGEGIFTLPIDYMGIGLSLPSLFTTNITIYFNESTQYCYDAASQDCRKRMIFSALAQFFRLASVCNVTNCGTVCRRNMTDGNKFSCCDQHSLSSQVDIDKCLLNRSPVTSILWIRIITIILSISISGGILVKIFNKYMHTLLHSKFYIW